MQTNCEAVTRKDVATLMKARDMSYRDLGFLVGATHGTVHRYLGGKPVHPLYVRAFRTWAAAPLEDLKTLYAWWGPSRVIGAMRALVKSHPRKLCIYRAAKRRFEFEPWQVRELVTFPVLTHAHELARIPGVSNARHTFNLAMGITACAEMDVQERVDSARACTSLLLHVCGGEGLRMAQVERAYFDFAFRVGLDQVLAKGYQWKLKI
jgi:hypothetical protein